MLRDLSQSERASQPRPTQNPTARCCTSTQPSQRSLREGRNLCWTMHATDDPKPHHMNVMVNTCGQTARAEKTRQSHSQVGDKIPSSCSVSQPKPRDPLTSS